MGKFRPIKRGDREFCESLEILLECDPCRVRWLDQIPEHLERLIGKGDLRGAENLGRIVGDLAGKCWGTHLARGGVLRYVLEKLEVTIPSHLGLAKQYLRIIGNCAIDNYSSLFDEADPNDEYYDDDVGSYDDQDEDDKGACRQRTVTESMEVLIPCFKYDVLAPTALGALTNLYEYEPAVLRAAELRLDLLLAEYLAKSFADRPVPSEEERVRSRHMIKEWDYRNKRQSGEAKPQDQPEDDWGEPNIEEDILDWLFSITQNLSPEQLHDSESLRTFNAIVKTSLTCKGNELINTYAVLFNAYLQDPIIQQKVIGPDFLGPIIDFTLRYATELPSSGDHEETTKAIMRALSTQQIDSEFTYGDDYEQVIRLVNSLSAISASDEFISQYNINSPELDNVKRELHSKARGPATVIACIMLGNLATSNEASESMTRAMNLHLPLLDILSSNEEPALLYAAAGFIRHLAFAEANREALAKAGLINVCCRLLGQSDPSVRGEAAAILGKLASNNLPNIKQIVFESPSVDGLPSHSSDTRTNTNETILQYLVTQALAPSAPLPSTSMKNVVIEIGRTIVTIMRSVSQQSNSQELALQVFKTPLVARPVARLVRQRFFADARAEGLLGLGLMAQFREGAECVIEEIQADKGLLEAVKELAGLQDSGKGQKTENWGRDHQNTLVLLHALGKNGVSAMGATLKNDIDVLQAELSKSLHTNDGLPSSSA